MKTEIIVSKIKTEFGYLTPIFFQELRSSTAGRALYNSVRKEKLNHIYFERAFFRGRTNFLINTINTKGVVVNEQTMPLKEASDYLVKMIEKKEVIACSGWGRPDSDRISKIMWDLFKKAVFRYALKKQSEEEDVFEKMRQTFGAWKNKRDNYKNSLFFEEKKQTKKYVFFPFQSPDDQALLLRSIKHKDQVDLVNRICKFLPPDYLLYATEHPCAIGALSKETIDGLKRENLNFRLLHPSANVYDIIRKAALVVTINSKVGAEAIALRKQVICAGNSFYTNSAIVESATSYVDLNEKINHLLRQPRKILHEDVQKFFAQAWRESYPGELLNLESGNLARFSKTLSDFLVRLNPTPRPDDSYRVMFSL